MSEFKFDIIKKIGVLSKSDSGRAKELNLISWNERDPKYDIRDWSLDGEKMGKGVTLSKEELMAFLEILNKMELLPGRSMKALAFWRIEPLREYDRFSVCVPA